MSTVNGPCEHNAHEHLRAAKGLNVWYINHYASPPSEAGGTRHFAIASALNLRGHRVTLMSSAGNFVGRAEMRIMGSARVRLETIEGVQFLWLRTPQYRSNGLGRLRNMFAFARRLLTPSSTESLPKPDIIIGSSPHPFAALAAQQLARRLKIPFVLEVRDLWPQSLMDLGRMSKRHPLIVLMRWIELHLYRHAARIVSVLPGAADYIGAAGGDAHKVVWIPNGVQRTESLTNEGLRQDQEFTLVYAGAHGLANGLDTVLDAALLLQKGGRADGVRIQLVGQGPEKQRLRERVEAEGIAIVEFEEALPKQAMPERLSRATAFLMPLKDSPVFRWGISPNKLFDYMAAAKPIIFAVNSPYNPIASCNAGLTIAPDNPAALCDAIEELRRWTPEQCQAAGRRSREYVYKHHDLAVLAERLEEVLLSAKASQE